MQIVAWLRRLARANKIDREYDDKNDAGSSSATALRRRSSRSNDTTTRIAVPKPGGAKAFEVVGIPLPQAGFYVVELASPKLGAALLGTAQAVLRARRDARDQSRRPLQARARVVARVGDAAQRCVARSPTPRSRSATAAATRTSKARPMRPASCAWQERFPSARRCRRAAPSRARRNSSSRRAPPTTSRTRSRTGARASRRGASTCRPATGAAPTSRTRCSTARSCAPARRCR